MCVYIYIYIFTYIHIRICLVRLNDSTLELGLAPPGSGPGSPCYVGGSCLGLYKIFVYFEDVVHESTILSPLPPTCIAHPGAISLHDDLNRVNTTPLPSSRVYAIYHKILVITISCKGQVLPGMGVWLKAPFAPK